jgi:hypothetical protein
MRSRCCFSRFAEIVSGKAAVGWFGPESGLAEGPLGVGVSVRTWVSGAETFCARMKKKYAPTHTANTPLKTYKAIGVASFRPGTVACTGVEDGRWRIVAISGCEIIFVAGDEAADWSVVDWMTFVAENSSGGVIALPRLVDFPGLGCAFGSIGGAGGGGD